MGKITFGLEIPPMREEEIIQHRESLQKTCRLNAISYAVFGVIFAGTLIGALNIGNQIWLWCVVVTVFMCVGISSVILASNDRELTQFKKVDLPAALAHVAELVKKYPSARAYVNSVKETGRKYLVVGEYELLKNSEKSMETAAVNNQIFGDDSTILDEASPLKGTSDVPTL